MRTASALRYSAASVSLLVFVQCAGIFGGMGKMLVSEQDEVKLGAEFNKTLTTNDTAKREMPIFVPKNQAQAEMQNYIIGLAKEIVDSWPAKEKPSYPFTYTLLDKDEENAFAVPGGYVYIYTGILKKLNDESELMGVLGHELTHVMHHHYSRQLAENTTLGIALQTVLVASNAGQGSQMAAGAASSWQASSSPAAMRPKRIWAEPWRWAGCSAIPWGSRSISNARKAWAFPNGYRTIPATAIASRPSPSS